MPPATVPQVFDLAVQHHQAGRLAEAEGLYRQILALDPNHAGAWHLQGVLAYQSGRYDLAAEWIRKAITLVPANPAPHSNLGMALAAQGRLDDAIAAYRQAITLKPDYAEAQNNLGNALKERGHFEEAASACRRAIALRPDYAEAHNNLGNALAGIGPLDEAVAAYRRAVALNPGYVEAWTNLGLALRERGRFEEATGAYRRALELRPNAAEIHVDLGAILCEHGNPDEALAVLHRALEIKPDFERAVYNLATALRKCGRLDEAREAYHRAIQLDPHDVQAQVNLAAVFTDLGQPDEALPVCHRALALQPELPEAHNNLGAALTDLGRTVEAMAAYRQAFALKPDFADARLNCSFLLLLHGDFEQGWPMYEARWDTVRFTRRDFPQPRWRGEDIAGRRILVHAEQGFGDSIQFIRYTSLIAERGGEVIVEGQRPLVELFHTAKSVREVVAAGDPHPRFDFHVPMLSQPLVFRTSHDSIPHEVPYLFADASRCATWALRLGAKQASLRIGLAWAGDPHHSRRQYRDVPLEKLAPLWRVEGVEFYSLQMGREAGQIQRPPSNTPLIDHTHEIADFADTAALMANLDLIISADTAVVHLAGAMGRTVWTLLPFVTDWRWALAGDQTPWYPSMRLFRQTARGDWDSVIQRVAEELERAVRTGDV